MSLPSRVAFRVRSDVIIIGGGAAGLGAARAARRRNATVTLVNDGPPGGDCTFRGCVPSKTLLIAARRGVSFGEAVEEVHRVIAGIAASEDAAQLRSEGINFVEGRGSFLDGSSLQVGETILRARRFIIATGASPLIPSIPGMGDHAVLTSDNVFQQGQLPARLTILGGGPIGVEMAEAFARLGSRVTVLEAAARILPREEPEASRVMFDFLRGLGVEIRLSTQCTAVRSTSAVTRVDVHSGSSIETDRLFVAVGRRPSSSSLGLDRAGVKVDDKGFVVVDRALRTTSPRIFAAGDVSQSLQFTHVADETGRIATSNALARITKRTFHPEWIPMVTYTGLEVARVGSVESAAPAGSRVAFLPMAEFDRARMSGELRGFVKIIVAPRRFTRDLAGGRIVGATVVAPRAGEMIQEIALAMRSRMWPARLATTTSAYPSWSMAVQQTTAQFFGEFGGRQARPVNSVE